MKLPELPQPNVREGFKNCKHGWQYDGPFDGPGRDDCVIVRCCMNCGRREMAVTRKFVLAKGDYALDEHYTGMIGKD